MTSDYGLITSNYEHELWNRHDIRNLRRQMIRLQCAFSTAQYSSRYIRYCRRCSYTGHKSCQRLNDVNSLYSSNLR